MDFFSLPIGKETWKSYLIAVIDMLKEDLMDSLKRTIGLAPSEDPEGFRERLRGERRRISESLQAFRDKLEPRGKPKGKKQKRVWDERVLAKAKELGYTMEQLEEAFGE